jgi:hypothetical protein
MGVGRIGLREVVGGGRRRGREKERREGGKRETDREREGEPRRVEGCGWKAGLWPPRGLKTALGRSAWVAA